ncbi:nucleoside-diphosphate kinase [Candidatus Nomurabacteria bacterium RIFOXYC2_FULL_36_19]|uniref:nucleoside-diphosphate kinase n=3 Tax=Candidatus Nomuraibacteriota TaxID=1752729 RepID=A0A1F6YRP1_9BACT|nr:MAG: Nucleoside-diphosphate kinase [Candidatus Nomurabacteria bacterium GW2011_GWC2_35_8]OGJ06801.1 MAG: nucleoside-diphosphate kinase [Candidatus Nomurabacteria bacterium RIFOXYA1_FULL_35_17]OGJ09007.1 MAG: nucleoside-diphosphate kinase [Candidatus Nomurabacteria bacterium RIFOXYC2_FULL_36_19]OGJ14885.1 MAG: nucleoside-diphosphate kinase [Candidatus Nomurabacteria bacterium RIFOXYD2_FULL_35_12]
MKNSQERTLVIFKPDSVQRGIVGEILSRFEKAGFKIVGAKMLKPDYDHYFKHYEDIGKMVSRRGKKVFDITLEMMNEGPVIAFVLEGVEVVAMVRKMVGTTEPKSALPGTIRGDYAHMSFAHADKHEVGIPNILHASGDVEEAKAEISHWFSEEELFDYETVHEKFTQKRKSHKKS